MKKEGSVGVEGFPILGRGVFVDENDFERWLLSYLSFNYYRQ